MPTIKTIHPSGFPIDVELDDIDDIDRMTAKLISLGYRPAITGDTWQRTPEGLPICPKHGEVMQKREKQGDTWHSHRVVNETTGEVSYCRGYATKNGSGYQVDAPKSTTAPVLDETAQREKDLNPHKAYTLNPRQTFYTKNKSGYQVDAPKSTTAPVLDETAQREKDLNPHKAYTLNPRQTFYKISGEAIKAGRIAFDRVNELTRLANTDGWGAALAGLQAAMR